MGVTVNYIVKKTEFEYYCMICDCHLSGAKCVDQHLRGRRHEASLNQFGNHIVLRRHNHQYFCNCCGCRLYGWINVHPHLVGKQHTIRLNQSHKSLGNCEGLACDFIVRRNDNTYRCSICNCSMSGPSTAKQHREGNRHAASMAIYGSVIILVKNNHHYYCKLCKCKFMGYYHVWSHINGKRHNSFRNEE